MIPIRKHITFLTLLFSFLFIANSFTQDKKIIFNCVPEYNGVSQINESTIAISGSNDLMQELSGSGLIQADTSSTILVTGDPSFDLLNDHGYLTFEYSVLDLLCVSSVVTYSIDSALSNSDELYITQFQVFNHTFEYPHSEVCGSSDILLLSTNIPLEMFQLLSDSLVFDSAWNVLPSISQPGHYAITLETNHCVDTHTFELNILDTVNPGFLPNEVSYCSNAITLLDDFENYTISTLNGELINQQNQQNLESQYLWFENTNQFCGTGDTVYVEILELEDVAIDAVINCNEAALSIVTPAQNYTIEWWNQSASETITVQESGEYWVALSLENTCVISDTVEVDLTQTNVQQITYSIEHADCWSDGELIITDIITNTPTIDFEYALVNQVNNNVVGDISNVPEGLYRIVFTDEEGCVTNYDEDFLFKQLCQENAPVFTPNGDGIEDEYFIPHEGQVEIYDRSGSVVIILEGPIYWDGRNSLGNLLPMGNYVLLTDTNRSVNITIVR